MFEKVSRLKLRFETPNGLLTVEDLWELPLTSRAGRANLDDIAKDINRALKATSEEESFVTKSTPKNEELQLALDVVKRVIEVKLAEAETAKTAADKRERKQKLLSLIAEKQDNQLSELSVEELQAQVEAL